MRLAGYDDYDDQCDHIRNSLSEEIWFGSDRSLNEEKFETWMQTERVWKNMERL